MQLCSICKKNAAIIQIMKSEGGKITQVGYCLSCAKAQNLGMVNSIIQQMGISEDDIDEFSEQMTEYMKDVDPETIKKMGTFMGNMPNPQAFNEFLSKSMPSGDTHSEKDEGDSNQSNMPNPMKERDSAENTEDTQENKEQRKQNPKRKFLDAFGTNMTERAANGEIDDIIGREKELNRVIQILNRRNKNNPVLIGEPGVGKTAIAEGLALAIAKGNIPSKLSKFEVYQLDMSGIVAGTQFRGQFEQRMKGIVSDAVKAGNIILVIDEIHNIVGAGSAEGAMNAANILKPVLAKGEIRIIGATTLEEYRKYIEKDSALERRFQPVMVNEPSIEDTVKILKGIKKYYEMFHAVKISDEVIEKAVMLSDRYITGRFLPDKAIDILDEAASRTNLNNKKLEDIAHMEDELGALRIKVESMEQLKDGTAIDYEELAKQRAEVCRLEESIKAAADEAYSVEISDEDLAEVVELWTGIPVQRVSIKESEKLINLEKKLHEHIVGQENAVRSVADTIRRCRTSLRVKKKPASFIFVGPTGVGKTELVKALTVELFESEDALIRLDMSEYMEKHTVSKLVGSPPGYVGYDDAGQLTEKVRRKPYSVILLDEIEKAHPDVFNMLLQILDDGRLTDSQGRSVGFENTVIIMTSNAGTTLRVGEVGFGSESGDRSAARIKTALKQLFRPEFLNRIDEIVVFDKLTDDNLKDILDMQLRLLAKDLAEKKITFTITEALKKYFIGYERNDDFGARPIKRSIQKNIEDRLAQMYLEGIVQDGTAIAMDYDGNEPVFMPLGNVLLQAAASENKKD